MNDQLQLLNLDIKQLANPTKAQASLRFFKTAKGQYGENDQFIGLTVPETRIIAKKYHDLSLSLILELLASPIHEKRMIALHILVDQFKKGSNPSKQETYQAYLKNTKYINNWDLVDSSADKIVGAYLYQKDTQMLNKLARSSDLWERRIAIIATYYFIQQGQSSKTFEIAKILLHDKQDLIHKAVGWMLREVGKRCSKEVEVQFLKIHYQQMPRTMLRYAIEHFSPEERSAYLQGRV